MRRIDLIFSKKWIKEVLKFKIIFKRIPLEIRFVDLTKRVVILNLFQDLMGSRDKLGISYPEDRQIETWTEKALGLVEKAVYIPPHNVGTRCNFNLYLWKEK